jgi:hypothetical protein
MVLACRPAIITASYFVALLMKYAPIGRHPCVLSFESVERNVAILLLLRIRKVPVWYLGGQLY